MKTYIGTKIIRANPMSFNEFQDVQGFDKRVDSDMEGYFVKYEDGYESWSPKETFEHAYRPMTDGEAEMSIEILPENLQLLGQEGGDKEEFVPEDQCEECIGTKLTNFINEQGLDNELGISDCILADYLLEQLNSLEFVINDKRVEKAYERQES